MKATPKKWPLWTNSFNRRVRPGEWGKIIKSELCGCPHNCIEESRFSVEFEDNEIVVALYGYWEFEEK